MTRKDFQLIADSLAAATPHLVQDLPEQYAKGAATVWRQAVSIAAHRCSETNPRFDCDRFIDACTVNVHRMENWFTVNHIGGGTLELVAVHPIEW